VSGRWPRGKAVANGLGALVSIAILIAGSDLSRRVLALEEYKAGRITKAELRRLLGFETRYELDGFLKAHDVMTSPLPAVAAR
jgi:hypothetical protein